MFNELSIAPLSPDIFAANEKMVKFCETFKVAYNKGFRKIRSDLYAYQIHLSEGYTLQDWFYNGSVPRRYRDLLLGIFITPFINENDDEVFNRYDQAKFYFEGSQYDFSRKECLGLGSAYLYETPCISLQSSAVWQAKNLNLVIVQESVTTVVKIVNLSDPTVFEDQEVKIFIENLGQVNLVECLIAPDDKKIHLSDHHGKTELNALCDKIKFSPYVIEMRSTFWGGKNFIRKVNSDGSVEVVLVDEERKYALLVQTTGRNLRETKAIAEILDQRYS